MIHQFRVRALARWAGVCLMAIDTDISATL